MLRWLAYHEGQTINTHQLRQETGTGMVYLTVLRSLTEFGMVNKYPMDSRIGAQWRWVVEESPLWALVRDLDKSSNDMLDL